MIHNDFSITPHGDTETNFSGVMRLGSPLDYKRYVEDIIGAINAHDGTHIINVNFVIFKFL